MFHTLITLAYTIPGLYLFLRIWMLFIEKRHRSAYIIIFAILYSIYPLGNFLDGNDNTLFALILDKTSGYLLPFFLYLFLLLLATDIILLLRLIINLARRGKRERKKPGYGWLLVLVCLSAAVVIYGVINFNTIRITRYDISIPARSSDRGTIKIVFVSDLHLGEDMPARFVKRFVDKANDLHPDVILFGGDIVEGGRMGRKTDALGEILKGLKSAYGVYGVPGNHDGYGRGNAARFFRNAGIEILRDSAIIAGKSFILAGRLDSSSRRRKTAEELIGSIKADLPVILLDHRPTDYEAIGKTRADIVLSGHTHNGQLFPINLITKGVYELSWGHLRKGSTNFFVSSGLRLWGPPVRTTGRSEIVVVDVNLK